VHKWARLAIGVLVRFGAMLAAFLLLSPSVWSRDDFDGLELAIGLAAASGWSVDRGSTAPWVRWVRNEMLFAIGFAATMVACYVLIGAVAGEGTLASENPRIAFGTAASIAVCFWGGLQFAARMPKFTDPDGESRRAEIRANIRREIAEIERSAGGASGPARHDAPQL